jgi:hypothetical protein
MIDFEAPTEFVAPADEGFGPAAEPLPLTAGPAATEAAEAAPGLDLSSIMGRLRAQGFGSFSAVARQGNAIVLQALKDGQQVQVTVDAGTGTVLAVQ